MKYLLDTNVLIALRGAVHGRESRDPQRAEQVRRIRERTQAIPAADLAMSMVSLGELRVWAEKHGQRAKAEALTEQLSQRVRCVGPHQSDPAGERIAHCYGKTVARLEVDGTTIGTNDAWIAAHALALDLTLVTNNVREFQRVPGLTIEDWTQ